MLSAFIEAVLGTGDSSDSKPALRIIAVLTMTSLEDEAGARTPHLFHKPVPCGDLPDLKVSIQKHSMANVLMPAHLDTQHVRMRCTPNDPFAREGEWRRSH